MKGVAKVSATPFLFFQKNPAGGTCRLPSLANSRSGRSLAPFDFSHAGSAIYQITLPS
jgi:hypothetical protein